MTQATQSLAERFKSTDDWQEAYREIRPLNNSTIFSRVAGLHKVRRYLRLASTVLGTIILIILVDQRARFVGFNLSAAAGHGIYGEATSLLISSPGKNSYVLLSEWYLLLVSLMAIIVLLSVIQTKIKAWVSQCSAAVSGLALLAYIAYQIVSIIGLHNPALNETYFSDYNALIRESLPVIQTVLFIVFVLFCSQVVDLILIVFNRRRDSNVVNRG